MRVVLTSTARSFIHDELPTFGGLSTRFKCCRKDVFGLPMKLAESNKYLKTSTPKQTWLSGWLAEQKRLIGVVLQGCGLHRSSPVTFSLLAHQLSFKLTDDLDAPWAHERNRQRRVAKPRLPTRKRVRFPFHQLLLVSTKCQQ